MELSRFCVDRNVIGSLRHLRRISDGSVQWIDELPDDEWIVSASVAQHDRCARVLFEVNGQKFPSGIVGETHRKAYAKLVPEVTTLPWTFCLPPKSYSTSLKKFLDSIATKEVDPSYVEGPYRAFRELSRRFRASRIDAETLENNFRSATNESVRRHLQSIRPARGGYVDPPSYDFFGTRTGRLTVSSGPLVLTLQSSFRSLFVPALKDGEILQVDFASLEPRLLLGVARGISVTGDLYDHLGQEALEGKATRDVTKRAVLGMLYGMSIETLSHELEIPFEDARSIMERVRRKFDVREQTEKIARTSSCGRIRNAFGRMVESEGRQHLNSFVQSSAVDVAHLGFLHLLERCEAEGLNVRPMFTVHDALVIEVSRKDRKSFDEIVSKGYHALDVRFLWKTTRFAKSGIESE